MKKPYDAPELVEYGTVAELTAALGSDSTPDYSDYPSIPASTGSFDICTNQDHDPQTPC